MPDVETRLIVTRILMLSVGRAAGREPYLRAGTTSMYRIETFGGVRILDPSGDELHFRSRKHVALLVYLRSRWRRVHLRQSLSQLFWETKPSLARHSLSQALYDLRSNLGQVIVNCPGDALRVEVERLAFDAQELEDAIQSDRLDEALKLYRAPFAPDLDRTGTEDFERWLEEERGRLQLLAQAALRRFLGRADDRGRWGEMCSAALRLIEMNSLDEGAHRALMRALWLHGDQASALDHFQKVRETLATELPQGLSQETLQLVERIRGSRPRRIGDGDGVADHHSLPLIGRERELRLLSDFVEQDADGAPVLLISGEAGIGKTRLVEELEKLATLAGTTILRSRCYHAESEVAYGPILDGLGEVAEALVRLEDSDRPAYLEIGALFPTLATPSKEKSAPADLRSTRRRLFEEVTDMVRHYCGERSVLWVVEDVHWVDSASSALLHYMIRRLREHDLRVVLTARPDSERSAPALRLLGDEFFTGIASTISLGPLAPEAVAELVSTASSRELDAELPDRIATLSGGNPFYALEILSAAGSEDLVEEIGVEDLLTGKLRSVLATRLRGLSATAVRILEALSVLDPYGHPSYVAASAGVSLAEAATECDELYARRLIHDDGQRLAFAHDITRDFVYENLGLVTRAALHLKAGEVLAGDPSISAAAIARHFERGDDRARAYEYGLLAAQSAVESAAHEEAVRMGKMAVSAAQTIEKELRANKIVAKSEWALGNLGASVGIIREILDSRSHIVGVERTRLQLRLADLLTSLSEWDGARRVLNTVVTETSSLDSQPQRIEILADVIRLKTAVSVWCKNEDALNADMQKLRELIVEARSNQCLTPKSRLLAAYALALHSVLYTSASAARELLIDVEPLLKDAPPDIHQRVLLLRSGIEEKLGNWDSASHLIGQVLTLSSQTHDVLLSVKARCNLGCISMGRGKWIDARKCFEEAVSLCDNLPGSATPLLVARLNLAKIQFFEGSSRDAIAAYRELLHLVSHQKNDLSYFEAEIRAGMALASLQVGDYSVLNNQWRMLKDLNDAKLRGIQERYLYDWLVAFLRQKWVIPESDRWLTDRARKEASTDRVASLKLYWLHDVLFRRDASGESDVLLGQLKELGLYWFARFGSRWLEIADAKWAKHQPNLRSTGQMSGCQ